MLPVCVTPTSSLPNHSEPCRLLGSLHIISGTPTAVVVLPLGHLVVSGMSFVMQYYSAYNANLKVHFWTSVFASSDQSEVGSSCGRRPVTEACARTNDPELGVVELADMQNTVGAVTRVEEDGVLGAQQTSGSASANPMHMR
jgi:hypothetical protein